MRIILFLFAAVVVLSACTNDANTTTDGADNANIRDTTYRDTMNVETNTVTPPASNGQF